MFTRIFWMKTGERALRAYIAAFCTVLVGSNTAFNADILEAALVSGVGAAASVLLSILGSQVGDPESPSLLTAAAAPADDGDAPGRVV